MSAVEATTLERRRALCSARITLDGVEAFLSGAACDFATVSTLDGRAYQWSWPAVVRIVARDGAFQS